MTNLTYLQGRKKYARPQAILFANNPGTIVSVGTPPNIDLFHIPLGSDVLASQELQDEDGNIFMILSDDNRQQLDFSMQRIEKRERMINGRMRSYHVADKASITVSWSMIPSRGFSVFPSFGTDGKSTTFVTSVDHDNNQQTPDKPVVSPIGSPFYKDQQYTTDGGAGGVEILDWYENNKGSFWVYLAYDKYNQLGNVQSQSINFNNLPKYNQVIEMFFADFSYSVVKRGGSNHDFWNISFTLEEV